MMEWVVIYKDGTYITNGTEQIFTPNYAKYGIWDAYLSALRSAVRKLLKTLKF